MAGFDLEKEAKRLAAINTERDELYREARKIVGILRGVVESDTATPAQKTLVRNAVKPYIRQKPKKAAKKPAKKPAKPAAEKPAEKPPLMGL
jgi:ParB-like chromosome segregation protein Spo0J